MIDIYYLGDSCFKIKGKGASLVINPFPDKLGVHFPKTEADVVLCTNRCENNHNCQAVSGATLTIDGPGEYETRGINIFGLSVEKGTSAIYKFIVDNVKFAHLGTLNEKLDPKMIEELEDVNVLFIPVNAPGQNEIIKGIEPQIVCPMHFQTAKYNKDMPLLADFVKAAGLEPQKVSGKLSIAKEKLPEQTVMYTFE